MARIEAWSSISSTFRRLRAACELKVANPLWGETPFLLPGEAHGAAGRLLLLAFAEEDCLLVPGVDDVDQVPVVVGGLAELLGDRAVEHLGHAPDLDPVLVSALRGRVHPG